MFLIGAVSATIGYAITSGGGFNPEVSIGGGATGIVGGGVTGAVTGGIVGGGVSGLFDRNRQGSSGLTRQQARQQYARRHLSSFARFQPHR